jgi:hypothetical protein
VHNLIKNSTTSAFAFWEKWHAAEDMTDEIADQFENIENFLLRSRPTDLPSCSRLLELVLDAMETGGRSDRLDIELLEHVQAVMGLHTATGEDSTTTSTIAVSANPPPISTATR